MLNILSEENKELQARVDELTELDNQSNGLIFEKLKEFQDNLERSDQEKSDLEEVNSQLSGTINELTEKC